LRFPGKYTKKDELEELEQKRLMILLWSLRFESEANPDEITLTKQEARQLEDFYSKY